MHERCFAESAESEIAEEKVTLLKTVESLDLAIMQSAQQHSYMPLSRLRSDDLPHLAVSLLSFKWNQSLDLTSIQTQLVSNANSLHVLLQRLCNLILPLHDSNALHCHHKLQG